MPPYTKRVLAQLIVRAWRAAAASPRRASSTSFERRVEAHVQDEAREEATAWRGCSRGDMPRPAPPACPRRGSERSRRRRRAGAGAVVMLADAAGSVSWKGTREGASLPVRADLDRTCRIQRS